MKREKMHEVENSINLTTYAVTGGAGFIGSHLCEALLKRGNRVICVDNFFTSTKENIMHLFPEENFTLVEHDITEVLSVDYSLPRPDYIFHLASPASPTDFYNYPLETMLVNSSGTHNVLEWAKKSDAKFLFASTSEVYGEPKEHPQTESYWGNVNPIGPRSCYDESKRFGEALATTYSGKYDLEVAIARIFNTFGPRMRLEDGRVIPNIVSQALQDEPLTIYGDGLQTRSFCYVDDMVEGLIKLMLLETNGQVINLGNPNETTVLSLAKKIQKMCNSNSELKFLPLPKDDPTRRKPDITKARNVLNWQPSVLLEEGLEKTIIWFQKNLHEEKIIFS